MSFPVDSAVHQNSRDLYVTTLDPEALTKSGRSVQQLEEKALLESGLCVSSKVNANSRETSLEVVRALTSADFYETLDRESRSRLLVISGHGSCDRLELIFDFHRHTVGVPGGFAERVKAEVVFLSTCFGGLHLRTLKNALPQDATVIGPAGKIPAISATWIVPQLLHALDSGVPIESLAYPRSDLKMIKKGESRLIPLPSANLQAVKREVLSRQQGG